MPALVGVPAKRAIPAAASTAQITSRSLRDWSSATDSGPTNSTVTATPSGMRLIAS